MQGKSREINTYQDNNNHHSMCTDLVRCPCKGFQICFEPMTPAMWVMFPPMWEPHAPGDCIRRLGLNEVIRVGPWSHRISVLTRRDSSSLCQGRTRQGQLSVYTPGRLVSPGTNQPHFDQWLPAPCGSSHPDCGICYGSLSRLRSAIQPQSISKGR